MTRTKTSPSPPPFPDPPADGFRVTEGFAWIVLDPIDNSESVPSFWDSINQAHMPLFAFDKDRVESLRPVAQMLADLLGLRMRLVRFTTVEEVDSVVPIPSPNVPQTGRA